jgi:hypothetical protein
MSAAASTRASSPRSRGGGTFTWMPARRKKRACRKSSARTASARSRLEQQRRTAADGRGALVQHPEPLEEASGPRALRCLE